MQQHSENNKEAFSVEPLKKLLWNIGQLIQSQKRDKTIVLFGAWFGNRFADNSRYLFQYLSTHKAEMGLTHVIWVTRNSEVCNQLQKMGYECFMMDSKESYHYHKIAGIHIICNSSELNTGDILSQFSVGALKVNLWHGLGGIKGVEFSSKQYKLAKAQKPLKFKLKEFLNRNSLYRKWVVRYGGWGDCLYMSTTPFQTEILEKYFYRDKTHFIEAGYPRNLPCLKLTDEENIIVTHLKEKNNVILYLPTFREKNENYQHPMENQLLKKMIQQGNFYWIEKKHNFCGLSSNQTEHNILRLNSAFDICTILPYVDLVITDYSSVSWDALYYNIPVFFYVPDIEKYENADRGFVLPKEDFLIGQVAYTSNELLNLLDTYQNNYRASINCDYEKIKKKMWGDNMNYEGIWKSICLRMKKNKSY